MTEHKFAELKEGERWGELILKPEYRSGRMSAIRDKIIPLFFGDTKVQHTLGQQSIKIYVAHSLNDEDFERQCQGLRQWLEMNHRIGELQQRLSENLTATANLTDKIIDIFKLCNDESWEPSEAVQGIMNIISNEPPHVMYFHEDGSLRMLGNKKWRG